MTIEEARAISRKPGPGRLAVGRRPDQTRDGMNKTEAIYAAELELRKRAGEVLWWAFEPWKFRLAKNTFYTPDFGVMLADGTIEVVEIKGHWEDDARVKFKVAAETFPMFVWRAVRISKGERTEEVMP